MRIGTACQILKPEPRTKRSGEQVWEQVEDCKMGTVKVCDVSGLNGKEAFVKIRDKVKNNLLALARQVEYISGLPVGLRMLRISSDIFPLIDHPNYMHHYQNKELAFVMQSTLKYVGTQSFKNGIRMSVHPSQFITLFSDREDVVDKSLRHVKIWIAIFKLMGLRYDHSLVTIVMHANGKSFTFPERAKSVKNWIGLENDEKKAGFEKTLKICQDNDIRMILDVHHYQCENGKGIQLDSDELRVVLSTWEGKGRPKMHISSSRGTANFRELCAHSDRLSESDMTTYAGFSEHFDIMVEAKHKNLAAEEFYNFITDGRSK